MQAGATISTLRLRDFRGYDHAEIDLSPGLTVIHGANGAGKTNLLEALYFGCTGRSFRTTRDRDLMRFGSGTTRVEAGVVAADGAHRLSVGFTDGEKAFQVDGARIGRLADAPCRPLVSVFAPDRLELVKGSPALRRGHLDQVVAALWPARAETRRSYGSALAQRNALLARTRTATTPPGLDAWDRELARHGAQLIADRAAAVDLVATAFPAMAAELGLAGEVALQYRPRSSAGSADELIDELVARRESDLMRGFTQHGPHRDDLVVLREGRELRLFGSQGEQRLALLTLLLAEREVLADERGSAPVLLLDDVMSELDAARRGLLVDRLAKGGQALITTTELAHVPLHDGLDHTVVAVADGRLIHGARAVAA